ncbi:MAG: winged helix-turn-helix transcriptional regulator [Acidobacteria bacterium]|nr:winged helix-turn-helix transcriptional regulator [Acidobacteriota bacterium]
MPKRKAAIEPWRAPESGPCACAQLRRAARTISGLYDELLAAAGVTVTQYGMLVNIARAERISRTELAAVLGMDRTTLTRNLRPLERAGFLEERPGDDRRVRMLRLTPSGRRRLERSYPLWEGAQQAFLKEFGVEQFAELRGLLRAAGVACKAARAARDE